MEEWKEVQDNAFIPLACQKEVMVAVSLDLRTRVCGFQLVEVAFNDSRFPTAIILK